MKLVSVIYALRILDYALAIGCLWGAGALSSENPSAWLAWIVAALFAIVPHAVMGIHLRHRDLRFRERLKRIEMKAFFFDAFVCGLTIPLLQFHPVATFTLSINPVAGLMATGGLRLWVRGFWWHPIGLLIAWWLSGDAVLTGDAVLVRNLSLTLLGVHIIYLCNIVYMHAGAMLAARTQVKQALSDLAVEQDKTESLLLNILPADVAAELKEHGEARARRHGCVSVLMTDFSGFTKAAASMSAEELVGEIDLCFRAFDRICDAHGVEKIKTIGDAYMAVTGLSGDRTDRENARDLVRAALEMQAFLVGHRDERRAAGGVAFEMRAGIHTGTVVTGVVGERKFQYDIWGDTVNTASRMESHGEIGRVNVSRATFEVLQEEPTLRFSERESQDLKGLGLRQMWFVDLDRD